MDINKNISMKRKVGQPMRGKQRVTETKFGSTYPNSIPGEVPCH